MLLVSVVMSFDKTTFDRHCLWTFSDTILTVMKTYAFPASLERLSFTTACVHVQHPSTAGLGGLEDHKDSLDRRSQSGSHHAKLTSQATASDRLHCKPAQIVLAAQCVKMCSYMCVCVCVRERAKERLQVVALQARDSIACFLSQPLTRAQTSG